MNHTNHNPSDIEGFVNRLAGRWLFWFIVLPLIGFALFALVMLLFPMQ